MITNPVPALLSAPTSRSSTLHALTEPDGALGVAADRSLPLGVPESVQLQVRAVRLGQQA